MARFPHGGAVAELDTARYGAPTFSKETTVTVLTTSTQIINNNPDRVSWWMSNQGSNDVDWTQNGDAVVGSGHPLAAGQVLVARAEWDGEFVTRSIKGIVAAGTSPVTITEVIRTRERR